MEIRPADDTDAAAACAIVREADDARVLSEAGWLHQRRTAPAREKVLELVAADGDEVVAYGACGLNTWTSSPGAGWCSFAVAARRRREGIGSSLLEAFLERLEEIGATKVTGFVRFSEEGERWAAARGWSRLLSGPLIAIDPRLAPEASVPSGFHLSSMREAGPEPVYDAFVEAVRDEPRPEPIENVPYDDFLSEWQQPDIDLDASSVI